MAAITFYSESNEQIVKAYLTIIRSLSREVKLMLLKKLSDEMEQDVVTIDNTQTGKHSLSRYRGILKDNTADEELRREHMIEKYGL